MNIITQKATVVAPPVPPPPPVFVGTIATVRATPECMEWDIYAGELADGFDSVTIDWGDGTVETYPDLDEPWHEYAEPGTYQVKIPDCVKMLQPSFSWEDQADGALALVDLTSNARHLEVLGPYAFAYCRNLTGVDLATVPVRSLGAGVFKSCTKLVGRLDLPFVNEINCSRDNEPFTDCPGITELHFGAANEAALKATAAYYFDPKFGAPNAAVFYDL